MGMPSSKFGQEIEQEEPTKGSLPSTPILTPKSSRLADLDPRSPSENIVRTPIDVFLIKNKKSLSIDTNETSPLNNGDITNTIYTPTVKLKSIDPRSPTVDFVRTPIVVPEDVAPLPLKLHNKNLDNVRKALMNSPLNSTNKRLSDKIPPPKLLESNVIINPKVIENKRKSYVGLLETNLDFIETDLDQIKPKIKVDEDTEDGYKLEVENEAKSDQIEMFSTPVHDTKSVYNRDICLNDLGDPRSPSTQFIRTPIPILQKLQTLDIANDDYVSEKTVSIGGNISTKSDNTDDSLNITPLKSNRSQSDTDKLIQLEQTKAETVKDFDKKLSNLIYEDKLEETIITNKKIGHVKSRMPLGTRNSNTNMSRCASKLKVHDKPRKNLRDFSKIPVFQNKSSRGKFNQQCENTPPSSLSKKIEKNQWDPDNTVII